MTVEEDQLWTREFTLLTLTNLLLAISFYFLLPTLPNFALKVLGADKSQIGYIIGVYTLAAVSVRPLAGYALDSVNRKTIYLYALALFTLLLPVYQLTTALAVLLLVRLLHGFAWGFVTTGGGTIVADVVPPKRRGEGIGYYGLSMTIAMAIGPLFGMWLITDDRFGLLFASSTALAAIALLLAFFIRCPSIPIQKRSLNWESFF